MKKSLILITKVTFLSPIFKGEVGEWNSTTKITLTDANGDTTKLGHYYIDKYPNAIVSYDVKIVVNLNKENGGLSVEGKHVIKGGKYYRYFKRVGLKLKDVTILSNGNLSEATLLISGDSKKSIVWDVTMVVGDE